MALILTLVFVSMNNKEELVAKDYYAQELKYQEKIDAINNTNLLRETLMHNVSDDNITLTMPTSLLTKDLSGEIYFFCPSNSTKDLKIKMAFDKNGNQIISKNKLQKGIYTMKLEWKSSGNNYFKEEVITIR